MKNRADDIIELLNYIRLANNKSQKLLNVR